MSAKITSKKDHILVEPQTTDFWELYECLGRELRVPGYPDKNAIWVIPDVRIEMNYDELYKLGEFVCKNYPKNAKPDRKVAIVVQTGTQTALANEYIKTVGDLPIKFTVFSDLHSAEEWIIYK